MPEAIPANRLAHDTGLCQERTDDLVHDRLKPFIGFGDYSQTAIDRSWRQGGRGCPSLLRGEIGQIFSDVGWSDLVNP